MTSGSQPSRVQVEPGPWIRVLSGFAMVVLPVVGGLYTLGHLVVSELGDGPIGQAYKVRTWLFVATGVGLLIYGGHRLRANRSKATPPIAAAALCFGAMVIAFAAALSKSFEPILAGLPVQYEMENGLGLLVFQALFIGPGLAYLFISDHARAVYTLDLMADGTGAPREGHRAKNDGGAPSPNKPAEHALVGSDARAQALAAAVPSTPVGPTETERGDPGHPTLADAHFEAALDEIESGRPVRATWARALAEAEGNEQRAKARYIALRARQLIAEDGGNRIEPAISVQREKQKILDRESGSEQIFGCGDLSDASESECIGLLRAAGLSVAQTSTAVAVRDPRHVAPPVVLSTLEALRRFTQEHAQSGGRSPGRGRVGA